MIFQKGHALIKYLVSSLLLIKSGDPLLENKYKNNAKYKAYVDSTPARFPFLKRTKRSSKMLIQLNQIDVF